MNFQDYIRYDAVGLAELIRKKEVSADEVLQAALNRLDEVNPKLNLLAHDLRERAAAWQGSSENADTPLAGVPFLLKDLLADWEGAPTWSGSRMMQHYIAKKNSDLTQAYLDAGLRVFGKTTTPEWGAYAVTETEIYGITRNPWHLDYTAGGSSGGAAAAVASGVVPAAHGSDGGGSIRLPAHNCGVFGLKPTRGRSSYAPNASEAWQGLVCDHVLTRSVRDSAVLLDIAAQTQARALYACPPPPENGFADILNLFSDKPRNTKLIPLNPFLQAVISEARTNDETSRAKIRSDMDATKEYAVFFDAGHLEQILHNLMLNAVKHAGRDDVEITVRTRIGDVGRFLYIDIQDNGRGVGADDEERIFEPFFSKRHGTGLGLYLVREMCVANQAQIVYVRKEIGACFRLTMERYLANEDDPNEDIHLQ